MKSQIRISKISIEMPKLGDEIWIHVTTQEVQWNDEKTEILNVVPRSDYIHKTASGTSMHTTTVIDPILKKEITQSGYGLHLSIEKMGMKWVQEALGGSFDEAGKLWL